MGVSDRNARVPAVADPNGARRLRTHSGLPRHIPSTLRFPPQHGAAIDACRIEQRDDPPERRSIPLICMGFPHTLGLLLAALGGGQHAPLVVYTAIRPPNTLSVPSQHLFNNLKQNRMSGGRACRDQSTTRTSALKKTKKTKRKKTNGHNK